MLARKVILYENLMKIRNIHKVESEHFLISTVY